MPIKSTNKNKKKKPRTSSDDKVFESRRAAFRAAKRDMEIPVHKHPNKVLSSSQPGWDNTKMDGRNNRLYIFKIIRMIFGKPEEDEIHFREDKPTHYTNDQGNQDGHFNTGRPPVKLKNHYFFKNRKARK